MSAPRASSLAKPAPSDPLFRAVVATIHGVWADDLLAEQARESETSDRAIRQMTSISGGLSR